MKQMDLLTFSGALDFLLKSNYSYFIMFLAMCVEGPIVTSAAAFAAALGYYNIFIIFILSMLGDLVSDILYYAVGFAGRLHVVERYGRFLGLTPERLEKTERYLKQHVVKGLIISKFLPVLPTLALITAGAIRMSFKKFALIVTLVIIPRSILFTALGYYFGKIFDLVNAYLLRAEYSILIFFLVGIVAYWIYKKISMRVVEKIENNSEKA